ncbi:hypothetical protein CIK75_00545 [Glutamicibacter sp. BW78]|nr:hypothetical protein CIK75_00545 [Glutamicibacter sp. BW78]
MYHRIMSISIARIIDDDRPLATAFALIGIGFLLSLVVGLVVGLLAEDFRSAFGWTGAIGMFMTAITLPIVVTKSRK